MKLSLTHISPSPQIRARALSSGVPPSGGISRARARARARNRNRFQLARRFLIRALIFLILLVCPLYLCNPTAAFGNTYAPKTPVPTPLLPTPPSSSGSSSGPFSSPYALDLHAGFTRYQSVIKPGCWVPVWAELNARAADLEGSLLLRQPRNQLQLELPVQVAKGSRKRYLGIYRFDAQLQPALEVELRLGRSGRDSFSTQLRFADDDERHILVLAESPGGFNFLNRDGIDLAPGTDETPQSASSSRQRAAIRRAQQSSAGGLGAARVIYGDPDFLPDDPVALESLDGVVVTTPRVRAVTPRQFEALRAWVMNGGNLLLAGGRLQPFIEQSALKGAFGLTLSPAEPLSASALFPATQSPNNNLPLPHPLPHPLPLNSINNNWKREGEGEGDKLGERAGDINTSSTTLLLSWPTGGWTRLELGSSRHPLIVSRRAGRGWFHLCAAALEEPFLNLAASRASAARLWPLLLERHNGQSPLEFLAGPGEGSLAMDLQAPFSFSLVGPGWIAIYLGSYLLLALPLAWFVCGRLKRREWAWPAAVALALAFAAFGSLRGLRGQPGFFQASEMTLVSQSAGASAARVATFSSIFSPRRFQADLALPPGFHPDRTVNGYNGNRYGGRADDLYDDRGLTLRLPSGAPVLAGFFFHPWSLRTLRADFTVAAEGGVVPEHPLALGADGKPLPGARLVNRSPWDFTRWWLTDGRTYWRGAGALARGTSVTLTPDTFAVPTPVPTPFYNSGGNPIYPSRNPVYARETLGTIAGQAAEANILAPTLREASTSPADPRTVHSYLKDLNYNLVYEPPSGELFFLGEASGAFSPLSAALPLERRHGVLLYETALPVAQSREQDDARPVRWRPDFLDPQMRQRNRYAYNRIQHQSTANTAELPLEFMETDVRLIPDRPLPPQAGGPLTFAFRLATRPNDDPSFLSRADLDRLNKTGALNDIAIDPVSGMPVGGLDPAEMPNTQVTPKPTPEPKITPPVLYKFAGCPVWIYNLRLHKWERTRILEDGHHTVTPLQDYLDPAASVLVLRIQADKSHLCLRRQDAGPSGEIKTGQDLWGKDADEISSLDHYNYARLEHELARKQASYNAPIRNDGYTYNQSVEGLLLTGLSVTCGDAATSTTFTLTSNTTLNERQRRQP